MYAVAVARGHVFNDGNKRTGLVAALTYLGREGIDLQRCLQLEEAMVCVAEGSLDEKGFAEILQALHHAPRF
ncbi:Fic family protein [Roseateles sp. UC29_93]|uniref:Fic family protein n=1 Tax=Roseateles TaxID=93681 RepID=UPI0036728526